MLRTLRNVSLTILLAASTPAWAADLSGTWSLDGGASDSIEPLLKATGVGYVQRKAASSMEVTQAIAQAGDVLNITTTASKKASVETVKVDGQSRRVTGDAGAMDVRHEWDGEALVTTSQMEDGRTLITRRSVSADGQTLTQRFTLRRAVDRQHERA
jgi:hypothetical protein